MPMIDPDLSRRAGNSQPEYNTHTPGRHWPGVFSDGTVGASDLLAILANWGPCP